MIRDFSSVSDAARSVIYGQEPAALDSDKFSEISLDQLAELEPAYPASHEFSPLQNFDPFSPEQSAQREELVNPLAAPATAIKESLSQLPIVASSVFSSFSSILKGSSPEPEAARAASDAIQAEESAQAGPSQAYPYPYAYGPPSQTVEPVHAPPPPPPTFYSPTDAALVAPAKSPPLNEGPAANSFRLKERKKAYAPIPGLNANDPHAFSPQPVSHSPSPSPALPAAPEQTPPKPSTFSLSAFLPSPLIDKIQNTLSPRPNEPAYQAPAAPLNFIDISTQQYSVPASNPPTQSQPPQFFNPQNFNCQAINKPEQAVSQVPAPQAFPTFLNASQPPAQTHQQPNPGQYFSPAPLAANPPAQVSPTFEQSTHSAHSSRPPSLPSSQSPFSAAQLPPPSTALPPAANQVTPQSYRLKGKPVYRKVPAEPAFGTAPAPHLPPQVFSSQPSVPTQSASAFFTQSAPAQPFYPIVQPNSSNFPPTVLSPSVSVFNPALQQPSQLAPNPSSSVPLQTPNFNVFDPSSAAAAQPVQFFSPQPSATYLDEPPLPPPPTTELFLPADQTVPSSVHPAAPQPTPPQQVQLFSPAREAKPAASFPEAPLTQVQFFKPDLIEASRAQAFPATQAAQLPQSFSQFSSQPSAALPPRPQSNSSVQGNPIATAFSPPLVATFSPPPAVPTFSPPPPPAVSNFFAQPTQSAADFFSSPVTPHSQSASARASLSSESAAPHLSSFFGSSTIETPKAAIAAHHGFDSQQESKTPPPTPADELTDSPFPVPTFSSSNAESEANEVSRQLDSLALDNRNNNELASAEEVDPVSFFNDDANDSSEFQIQNFFNNPPLLPESLEVVQDNNFNFIEKNVTNKRIARIASAVAAEETQSQSSFLVEPPSSAPSEFSEYAEQPFAGNIANRSADTSAALDPIAREELDGSSAFGAQNLAEMARDERASSNASASNIAYRPVYKHWFYKVNQGAKPYWTPFSFSDSMALEEAFVSNG